MALLFYNVFLILYGFGARLISPWNPKARQWIRGRKNLFERLSRQIQENQVTLAGKSPLLWMHCASLGEFEQGRPVIEGIRSSYPGTRVIITFFSPSGYEIRKNYPGADFIYYLPMDSAANARRFLEMVQPDLVLWVKYEYWYYFLREIKNRNIPLLLISGLFRKDQAFFKWYG
ncbi:MAG: 3-deoxy-D-manno-octulosonic acid transferase, partial [Chitinophagaceae bacterium]